MKERGILFSAPMVRALLAGTKTQTRRVSKATKGHDDGTEYRDTDGWPLFDASVDGAGDLRVVSPYGKPGDRLWVREAFRFLEVHDHVPPRELTGTDIRYAAGPLNEIGPSNPPRVFGKLRPGMFMPRWASRITLEVTDVRVERLLDISDADCIAEGIGLDGSMFVNGDGVEYDMPRDAYLALWDAINGDGSAAANPWVWAVSFKRIAA